jgi:hypothetical protein
MKIIGSLSLVAGGEVLNLRVENLLSDPVSPLVGQVWYNTNEKLFKYFDGVSIRVFASITDLSNLRSELASIASTKGASMVGVEDASGIYTAANVEAALLEVMTKLNTEITDRGTADTQHAADMASTLVGKGAALVGINDAGSLFVATTTEAALQELMAKLNQEITDRTTAINTLKTDLASTANAKGASLIGIEDATSKFTATTVEGALFELDSELATEITNRTAADNLIRTDLASQVSGKGASLVGVEDAAGKFTGTTTEAVLAEIDTAYKAADTSIRNDYASTASNKGASMVGLQDTGDNYTATTVEGALAEIHDYAETMNSTINGRLNSNEGAIDNVEAAIGSSTGTAGMNYTSNNYVVDGTAVTAAIGALDTQLKTLETLAGASDLQTAYLNSAGTSPDGHARIKLETGKDFRVVDDTDDSAYFMVDAETGNVIITRNLLVSGQTIQHNSNITNFDSQKIEVGVTGNIGLDIRPGANYELKTDEQVGTGNGSTTTFTGTLIQGAAGVAGITITDGVETFHDDNNGFLVGSLGGTGTINVSTGLFSVAFKTAPTNGTLVRSTYGYKDGYVTPVNSLLEARANATDVDPDIKISAGGNLVVKRLAHFDGGIAVTGNISVSGTVDGVDVSNLNTSVTNHLDGGTGKHDASEIDYEKTDANYIASGSSVEAAITTLDAEIKEVNDLIGGGTGESLTTKIAKLQEAVGSSTGASGMDYTATNYVSVDQNVVVAISTIDAALKTTNNTLAAETSSRIAADAAIRTDLASTVNAKGASLIGVEDAAGKFTGATVEGVLLEIQNNVTAEVTARTNADTQHATDLASSDGGKGASLIGISDVAGKFTGATVEAVLAEIDTAYKTADALHETNLASTASGKGASLIGVEDTAGKYTATTVEGALNEVYVLVENEVTARTNADTAIRSDLASTVAAKGASLIGLADTAGKFTATTVEAAFEEISDRITGSTFVYTSSAPASSHVVNHNFGKKYVSAVTIYDATDNVVIPQSIVVTGPNSLTVTFNSAIDCTVTVVK